MEPLTRFKLTFTAALGLFTISACSGVSPTIKYESTGCDETRTLDLKLGDIVDITDVGNKADFEITGSGGINVPKVSDKITKPDEVDYIIGDKNKPPYYIIKSTGTGNGDVQIEKTCPVQPATPTPKPTSTPYSYLGKGSGRLASMPSGFHTDVRSSKPVRTFRGF